MTVATAKLLLEDMIGKTFIINDREEIITGYRVDTGKDCVFINTDVISSRRHPLLSFAAELKKYRKPGSIFGLWHQTLSADKFKHVLKNNISNKNIFLLSKNDCQRTSAFISNIFSCNMAVVSE